MKVKELFLAGRGREVELYNAMFLLAERPGCLLDVGCGNGAYLCSMRDRGWDVMGLEVDAKAARIAKERFGLHVVTSPLESAGLQTSFFDAITLSHVIEHVPDPQVLLRQCFLLLKIGGKLAITTPNLKSLAHHFFKNCWGALDPPRHLVLFCPRSLVSQVNNAGFRIVMVGTGERTASGMFMMSSQISSFGRVTATPIPSHQSAFRTLRRIGFVFAEHWAKKFFKDIGEEIGILAMKT
jgi:SAM-dependent methyltransferase